MPFYRAALPLSRQTLAFVAGIVRRYRKAIGSGWRKLNPGQQALLVLAYLWKGDKFAELAAGFGVGITTAWRYVQEAVALLAARAPRLRQAVRDAAKAGYAYVVVDGATRAARTRKSRTGGRTSRSPRKPPTAPNAKLRSPGEHANARLKTWSILRKLRCCPW